MSSVVEKVTPDTRVISLYTTVVYKVLATPLAAPAIQLYLLNYREGIIVWWLFPKEAVAHIW